MYQVTASQTEQNIKLVSFVLGSVGSIPFNIFQFLDFDCEEKSLSLRSQ